MSKNILVIGGSYFTGRVFCILASAASWQLSLLNRGRFSMNRYPGISEYRGDRRDASAVSAIPEQHFDAVVDLCGYAPGDIRALLSSLRCTAVRYIFISTADVYAPGPGIRDENSPLRSAPDSGPVGEYIHSKLLLEAEAAEECDLRGIPLTVLRPAFIYGPYNYAPRESFYVESIVKRRQIPVPTDAAARFQFVYVKDMAEAIMACVDSPLPGNAVYNLAAPEILDYPGYMEVLRQISDIDLSTYPVTVSQVIEQNLPLPFPLTAEESEVYDGSKICRELGLNYTPFAEGMAKTYLSFKPVYESR